MKKSLPKKYVRKIWRAIIEFEMLEPGDRVLVGLSGGKDSLFLLYAMAVIKEHAPFEFDLGALTVQMGFPKEPELTPLADFCRRLEVPYYTINTKIAEMAFDFDPENPCARCAFFRRAAMNDFARQKGYNKIALAHHHDDAVETFLMSQLYSGQIKTFMPKSFMDRSGITVIRPLVYLREKEIRETVKFHGVEPVPSPCPVNGKTKREEVKQLIRSLTRKNHAVYDNLSSAMRRGGIIELWPEEMTKREAWEKSKTLWKKEM